MSVRANEAVTITQTLLKIKFMAKDRSAAIFHARARALVSGSMSFLVNSKLAHAVEFKQREAVVN
jgi:hypothetical protein